MYCLTSRLLLLLFVGGACAPVLQAFSAEPPHACCLRKMHGSPEREPGLHDATPHQGNCCPPMATPHSANLSGRETAVNILPSSELALAPARCRRNSGFDRSHSSRAPPVLS